MKLARKMSWALLGLSVLTLVLLVRGTNGAIVPAESNSTQIPDVVVWDEASQKISLWDKLRKGGNSPVIVLPVYTRCTTSCPLVTRKLKEETPRMGGGSDYRVLLFSFDSSEDAESLREFREREQLPANWMLVHAGDAGIRRFCDFFHYSIMTEGAVLIHPNEIFLLDRDLHWRATLIDVDWDAAKLQTWMDRIESPGISGWVAMNPGKLVWIGLGGLSAGLLLTLCWLIWRRPSGRSATA